MNFTKIPLVLLPFLMLLASCKDEDKKEDQMAVTVENIGLYDQYDEYHNLYYYDDAKAIVLYVQGNGCPMVRNGYNTFQSIHDQYIDRNITFLMVNSNSQDDREEIKIEAEEFKMDIPILVDNDQFLANNLKLNRTSEVLIINPIGWSIIYRGPIDDQLGYEGQKVEAENKYLINALDAFLDGRDIIENFIKSKGCAITIEPFVNEENDLTYTKDIAPILEAKCIWCHQPDGIASWAMTDYKTVRGWSSMMREVLLNNRMPPWQADPHYGKFQNDLSISDEQKKQIIAWIDAGKERGKGDDPLISNIAKEKVFTLGVPDTIITLDEQKIPENGLIDYRYQIIDLASLSKDIRVKAVEILPGNPEVLHHILGTIRYKTEEEAPVKRVRGPWLDGIFMVWAPGMQPEKFPEGTARTLPKDTRLYIQSHYTTNGKEASDVSKIGLYYADKEDLTEYVSLGPADFEFQILPNKKRNEVTAVEKIDRDITLYSLFPHMHFRGKSFRYTLVNPDKSEEIILNVPNYNFNWQRQYYLKEPKSIAAGSLLKVEAVFDNSEQNPFNPKPQDTVRFGEQTKDEMMIGYFNFIYNPKKDVVLRK